MIGKYGTVLAALATLVACGPSAEPTVATRSAPAVDPAPAAAPPVEAPAQSGDEVEEPPAPDASILADGRALAAPGPEGYLATWRRLESRAAPLDDAEERALGAPCPDEGDCEAPEVVAFDEERVDLREARRLSHHETVYLGATLLVPRDTRAHLLVGMKGRATVRLDGEVIGTAESPDKLARDRLLVTLDLPEGEHRLVLRFDAPERGAWRGTVRWLSARMRPGPGNVAIALGRLSEPDAAALARQAVRLEDRHVLGEDGPELVVRADVPGGGVAVPVEVTIGESTATLSPGARVWDAAHEVREPMPDRGVLDVRASVGDRTERFGRRIVSDRATLEAAASLAESLEAAPEASRAPIDWRRREALRVVREHDGDPRWRAWLSTEARRIARDLGRERDPFGRLRGYERMAFYSRLDGTPQQYELFVPPGYRPSGDREWPLLVTLHGYKGNAGDYFRNTFGLARDYEARESLLAHGRHGTPPTRGPMFVIAPVGRGQSFYRHAGEVDIIEAMDDVRERFRIDENRLYITGGSMGGTGAAYIPFRHPDTFAASAALAGYHDQRVRSDTNHEGLSDAERFVQAHRSDVDWAENALHLPMLLVRGTRDRPLAWTRVLVDRLDELGYRHEHREPDSGHNVWTETYAEGAIFRWLGRYRRPEHPAHVRLRTARERTRRAWWVTIEQRAAPDAFAEVDARIDDGVITATIEGAAAVTFEPGPPLVEEGAPLTVRVGDDEVTGPAPLTVEAHDGGWRAATGPWPQPGSRRAGVSGPIRDVFHEPLTFVVGTQDPDHTLLNRLVARHWAHPKGWIVDYPIVDDDDVTDAMMAERTLVLIGPPSSNSVHARLVDRLPIQVRADGVHVGDAVHSGPQVGAAFVAPNPEHPDRAVLVLAGPRPLGTWRANDLPDALPDYVVWDERIEDAHGRWACGGSDECAYLAHGLFDMFMRLPP